MVERLLRLKLNLLQGTFRRNPIQIVGLVIALFYGLGTAGLLFAGLVAMRWFGVEYQRDLVVFGAAVTLIFTVLPLVLGIDDTLDPRRFTLFGIRTGRLAYGLAVASVLSVPSLMIIIVGAGTVVTFSHTIGSTLLAIVGALLVIATCILSARVTTTLAAFVLASRRARDIAGIVGFALLVALVPLALGLASVDWAHDGLALVGRAEKVVAWTPLGAAWAVGADASAGDFGASVLKLLIAVTWLALLGLLWRALVAKVLVTPVQQAAVRVYTGLGWFDRMPATPIGAIAARNLTYWMRDSRYGVALAVIPLIPVVMVIALHVAGIPLQPLALLPVPVASLFLSWAIHNDVSFDNTAIWLHLVSSVRGRSDRWGRVIPVLLVGVPIVVVGSIVSAWAFGDWLVLPSVAGVSSAVLLSGLGLSSVMSAAFPYPAVRPGDSPFSQPSGAGSPAGLIQAFSFGLILLCAVPAIGCAALGFAVNHAFHGWALVVGLGVGLIMLFGGTAIGARVYDRRSPLLLDAALRN